MKMEKTAFQYTLIFSLVLGLLVGQSTATFVSCYEDCFVKCLLTPGKNSTLSCAGKCLSICLLPEAVNFVKDGQYFCKLGCVISSCTKLGTKGNHGVEKLESCRDSCSETCTKN